jgi:hypothetical protein
MDVETFTDSLRRLAADDLRRCAAGLNAEQLTVADEVVQWRAELAIDRVIRSQCTRSEAHLATAAAQRTTRLVVEVARRNGMELPDGDVTRVARTAGQIARGLTVVRLAGPFVRPLLARFEAALDGASSPVPAAA